METYNKVLLHVVSNHYDRAISYYLCNNHVHDSCNLASYIFTYTYEFVFLIMKSFQLVYNDYLGN